MKTPISDKFYNVGEEWRGVPSPRESLAFAQQMERDLMDFQERESRMCQRNQNRMNENETPETDEEAFVATYDYWEAVDVVRVSFAERLEIERNQLRIKNETLIDAKIKAENAECLMELKVEMMDQDLETIRKIITKGGTVADVLKFLDTPPA
jgi:hypothetical protein